MKVLIDNERIKELNCLCNCLNVKFHRPDYLHQALTHTSYANEYKNLGVIHNERLEFLGDAVLDLVITEHLFRNYPNLPEGELTKARAIVVCEPTLAKRASELGIGKYLLLGKGEIVSGGRERISILADSFEAIIGAIYLDSGFKNASQFVLDQLQNDLLLIERGEYVKDYKTLLQEIVQKNSENRIAYEVVGEHGPDHDKVFEVSVLINASQMGIGSGRSKKEAEQKAAKQALIKMNIINNNKDGQ